MKVQVVSDYQGRIVSISVPGDVGHPASGIQAAGIVPTAEQRIHMVEFSEELRARPLLEIHNEFRVQLDGDSARLVPAREVKGPFPSL
jgi:hypothetical protein